MARHEETTFVITILLVQVMLRSLIPSLLSLCSLRLLSLLRVLPVLVQSRLVLVELMLVLVIHPPPTTSSSTSTATTITITTSTRRRMLTTLSITLYIIVVSTFFSIIPIQPLYTVFPYSLVTGCSPRSRLQSRKLRPRLPNASRQDSGAPV